MACSWMSIVLFNSQNTEEVNLPFELLPNPIVTL